MLLCHRLRRLWWGVRRWSCCRSTPVRVWWHRARRPRLCWGYSGLRCVHTHTRVYVNAEAAVYEHMESDWMWMLKLKICVMVLWHLIVKLSFFTNWFLKMGKTTCENSDICVNMPPWTNKHLFLKSGVPCKVWTRLWWETCDSCDRSAPSNILHIKHPCSAVHYSHVQPLRYSLIHALVLA